MKNSFQVNNVDAQFTPGRFALFLALLIFANFPGVILGSHTFYYRDYLTVVFPYAQYNHDCFLRGEFFPLWNPLNHCGVPYLAQWQTFVLYPIWWLFLPFAASWSLGVFMLGHLLLAGVAMYFLAHRWTNTRIGACIAGVIYTFNGMMQNSLTWPHIVAALAWAPLVILLAESAWKEGGKKIIWAAVVGAMQMLTGAPEQILFTWFILTTLAFLNFVQSARNRGNLETTTSSVFRIPVRFILIAAIIAALAAAQLLPFLDMIAHSQRSASFAGSQGAKPGGMTWSVPGWGWANLLVPLFYNFPTPSGIYFQATQYLTSSYYLGIATLLFCVSWIRRRGDARTWLLGGIFLLSFVLALGEHGFVYGWMQKIFPLLGFMRYPSKFMFLASMTSPLLAAYGVSHFLLTDEIEQKHATKRLLLLGGMLLLTIIGILGFARQFPLYPGMASLWPIVEQNGGLRVLFLGMIVSVFAILPLAKTARLQSLLALGAVVLFWLDLQTQTPISPNPTTPRWAYDPGVVKLNPPPKVGEERVLVSLKTQLKFQGYQSPSPTNDVLFNRMILLDECNLIDGIPAVGGTHTLLIPESDRVGNLLLTTNEGSFPQGLADFLGVSHISDEQTLDWKARNTFLPIATAGQSPVFADDRTTFISLAQNSFHPRETVFLPTEARSSVSVTNASATIITSLHCHAERIDLKTTSEGGGWVVLAQSFYHNWHAYVDGQPTRIWKANYGFQALEVPNGTHEVKVVYEDKLFQAGVVISLLAWVGCLLAGWKWRTTTV